MNNNQSIHLFDHLPIGICVIESNFNILCWNHSMESLTKIPSKDAIGKFLYDLYPEFNRKINVMRINEVAKGGPPSIFSASLNKTLFAPKNDEFSVYYYEVTASSLPLDDIESQLVVFSVEDKTSLYKKVKDYKNIKDIALEEIERRKIVEDSLKLANESKDKFISIMAHDIKNPLGVIQSVSDFLLKTYNELEEEEIFEFLSGLFDSSKKVNALINDLLTWARTQSGKMNTNLFDENLYELVKDEIDYLKNNANDKSIEVINKLPINLIIPIDNNMIRTLIRNLISNAIKFTRNGGKIIVDSVFKDNHYEFSVQDNGVGISDKDKEKLFRIGESVSKLGTNSEGGTGLGLLLCKEFIELHHGKIWVESELEKGSTFKFTIPFTVN